MYYFIVNPKSRSGKGLKIWETIAPRLEKQALAHKVFFTEERHHATLLAKKLSSECAPCTIVAVGGDGTANEVIDGLENYEQIRFGYIPTGSGNDLARGLSLPARIEDSLHAILHPQKIQPVNIGIARFDGGSHKFIISSGIGFDAAVCHEAMNSRIKNALNHFGMGSFTYLGIALKQLILTRPAPMSLTADGSTYTYSGNFFVAAMNLKYEGGGFMFCPEADYTDDYLDLCIVQRMPKLKVLALLPTAFFGRHTKYKGIQILRCRTASICSSLPLVVHADGETQGFHTSVSISLCEQKLPFILG